MTGKFGAGVCNFSAKYESNNDKIKQTIVLAFLYTPRLYQQLLNAFSRLNKRRNHTLR